MSLIQKINTGICTFGLACLLGLSGCVTWQGNEKNVGYMIPVLHQIVNETTTYDKDRKQVLSKSRMVTDTLTGSMTMETKNYQGGVYTGKKVSSYIPPGLFGKDRIEEKYYDENNKLIRKSGN